MLPRFAVELLELAYSLPSFLKLDRAARDFAPDLLYERYNLFYIAGALVANPAIYWGATFVALFFLFFNTGPLNAAICNVVPASMRASAIAANVFVIHMLGDVLSPIPPRRAAGSRAGAPARADYRVSSWPGTRRCSPASPAGTGCRPSAPPPRPAPA